MMDQKESKDDDLVAKESLLRILELSKKVDKIFADFDRNKDAYLRNSQHDKH